MGLSVGSTLGNIRVLSAIGQGGMGEVYLGLDERLQRRVALKTIRAGHRLDPASRARFLREARILSQLDHPHICRVYDYIAGSDADVLVLEYIEGRPLTGLGGDSLAAGQKLRIAEQVAAALAAAHERGIVHRDLKPGNVLLTRTGDVKVVDFGLAATPEAAGPFTPATVADAGADGSAPVGPDTPTVFNDSPRRAGPDDGPFVRSLAPLAGDEHTVVPGPAPAGPAFRTQIGTVMGTPHYMSPEQARGDAVTPASDMYAFGLLLQEVFTGQPPHSPGLPLHEVLDRAAAGRTNAPGAASADIIALIRRLKAAAPATRPTAVETRVLLQRIREKPRRRAIRLGAAALGTLIALGAVKYILDVRAARDEANRRRVQAEDLIGFMLGDLRERLEPVGRLELLAGVADKALTHFASLPADDLSNDDWFRQAQAMMQVGQVRIAQGQPGRAREAFQQALSITRRLASEPAAPLSWQAASGAAHFWVGFLEWNEGRLDDALGAFRQYLAIAQRLVAQAPDDPQWQMELAQARNNVGAVLVTRGDAAGAVPEFQAAVGIKQRLVARDPGNAVWQKELADSHSWLGDALRDTGDLAGAIAQYRATAAIFDALRQAEPDNRQWQNLLALAHNRMGHILRTSGTLADALVELAASRDLLLGLVSHDPTNLDWKRDLAGTLMNIGRLQAQLGEPARAIVPFNDAIAIQQTLLAADGANADWRLLLAGGQIGLAQALEAARAFDAALAAAARALDAIAPLLQANAPDVRVRRRAAEAALVEARVLDRTGRSEAAGAALDRALSWTDDVEAATKTAEALALRAEALLRSRQQQDAAPLLAELDRQGFTTNSLTEARATRRAPGPADPPRRPAGVSPPRR